MMKGLVNSAIVMTAVLGGTGSLAAAPDATGGDDFAQAIFAGGCFWCMEPPYDKLEGVVATTSGYTGGHLKDPSYEEVTAGDSGHYEAVRVTYDPDRVSYQRLLEVFWRNIDPFDAGGQFCDRGSSYRSAIFYGNERQEALASKSLNRVQARFDKPVVTPVVPAETFWPAEDYHQNYYEKNPVRYKFYRYTCGRDARLEEIWGKQAGG
jgi:peptide-methionine (S)-S-oxide reductase